jgi:hypothetical protein
MTWPLGIIMVRRLVIRSRPPPAPAHQSPVVCP